MARNGKLQTVFLGSKTLSTTGAFEATHDERHRPSPRLRRVSSTSSNFRLGSTALNASPQSPPLSLALKRHSHVWFTVRCSR